MSVLRALQSQWEWITTILAVAFIAAVLLGCTGHGPERYTKALEVLL